MIASETMTKHPQDLKHSAFLTLSRLLVFEIVLATEKYSERMSGLKQQ